MGFRKWLFFIIAVKLKSIYRYRGKQLKPIGLPLLQLTVFETQWADLKWRLCVIIVTDLKNDSKFLLLQILCIHYTCTNMKFLVRFISALIIILCKKNKWTIDIIISTRLIIMCDKNNWAIDIIISTGLIIIEPLKQTIRNAWSNKCIAKQYSNLGWYILSTLTQFSFVI